MPFLPVAAQGSDPPQQWHRAPSGRESNTQGSMLVLPPQPQRESPFLRVRDHAVDRVETASVRTPKVVDQCLAEMR